MCQPNIRIELKLGEASRERVVIATDDKGKVKTMDLSAVVDAGICWQVLAGGCCAADLRRCNAIMSRSCSSSGITEARSNLELVDEGRQSEAR